MQPNPLQSLGALLLHRVWIEQDSTVLGVVGGTIVLRVCTGAHVYRYFLVFGTNSGRRRCTHPAMRPCTRVVRAY